MKIFHLVVRIKKFDLSFNHSSTQIVFRIRLTQSISISTHQKKMITISLKNKINTQTSSYLSRSHDCRSSRLSQTSSIHRMNRTWDSVSLLDQTRIKQLRTENMIKMLIRTWAHIMSFKNITFKKNISNDHKESIRSVSLTRIQAIIISIWKRNSITARICTQEMMSMTIFMTSSTSQRKLTMIRRLISSRWSKEIFSNTYAWRVKIVLRRRQSYLSIWERLIDQIKIHSLRDLYQSWSIIYCWMILITLYDLQYNSINSMKTSTMLFMKRIMLQSKRLLTMMFFMISALILTILLSWSIESFFWIAFQIFRFKSWSSQSQLETWVTNWSTLTNLLS